MRDDRQNRQRQGVGDAFVGDIGLAVDAVGIDLEQDDDTVSGAAGGPGGGHTRVQGQVHDGV